MSITQDLIKNLFEYRDGCLYWKIKQCKKVNIGARAGHTRIDGRRLISVKDILYLEHRLIFLLHHGWLPEFIDHIDNNPANNRIENLREATKRENGYNAKVRKDNTSGVKGVHLHKPTQKWHVRMWVNGKRKSFGYFDDLELANLVAIEARSKYHKEFARNE